MRWTGWPSAGRKHREHGPGTGSRRVAPCCRVVVALAVAQQLVGCAEPASPRPAACDIDKGFGAERLERNVSVQWGGPRREGGSAQQLRLSIGPDGALLLALQRRSAGRDGVSIARLAWYDAAIPRSAWSVTSTSLRHRISPPARRRTSLRSVRRAGC
ncbi:hypothetical protein [Piscinibacter sp. XHJ-5]|uniref:hypothetical protein n=1 Tax=Piscinibacter sp. XHJ-5 TaxID=3037797 RepID=UPI00245367A6|nr:hypothetical protein [Piscinibacter sp. XHJ-5]